MSLRTLMVLATAAGALAASQATAAPIVRDFNGRTATIAPKLTTAGDPANYTVPPGGFSDGVAGLILDVPGPFFALCTGSLLPTGRHVLTAAHCVSDEFGAQNVTEGTATFRGDDRNYTYRVQSVTIHPDWDGDYLYGNDIAVIELSGRVNEEINRYDIYRGTDEVGQIVDKYGFGRSGNGADGDILPSGTLRTGKNLYDATGDQALAGFNYFDFLPGSQLWYDFDNGNPANDAFGYYFGPGFVPLDLGLGLDEVNSAPGDSGGPSFIGNLVAGVTSYGITFLGDDVSDVTQGIDSSFGEFSVDTRVSTYASFVDMAQRIVTVPAPATLPILAVGLMGAAFFRRRRTV